MHLDDRPSHRYSRASDLAETRVGSSYLLLHTGSWNYFEFDPVGSAIWTLLDSPRSLDELVADLTRTFAVDPDRCAAETETFLTGLVGEGLVIVEEAGPSPDRQGGAGSAHGPAGET
jgi:hypothetical protein